MKLKRTVIVVLLLHCLFISAHDYYFNYVSTCSVTVDLSGAAQCSDDTACSLHQHFHIHATEALYTPYEEPLIKKHHLFSYQDHHSYAPHRLLTRPPIYTL